MEKLIKKLLKLVILVVAIVVLIDILTGSSDEAARAYVNMSSSTVLSYNKQDFANYTLNISIQRQNEIYANRESGGWGERVLAAAEEAFRLYGTSKEDADSGSVKEHAGRMITYLYNNIDSDLFLSEFSRPVTLSTNGVSSISEAWCAKFTSVVLEASGAIDAGIATKNVNANQLFIDLYKKGNIVIAPSNTFIESFGGIGQSNYSSILSLVDQGMKESITAAIDEARRAQGTPEPGDIAFVWYNHETVKRLGHVGIVVSYTDEELVLIEGNNAYSDSFYAARSGNRRDNSLVIKRTYRWDDDAYPVYKRCIVFIRLK